MNRVRMPFIRFKNLRGRGQGLVEFALALPIFLLLVLGVVEFGRLLAVVTSVTTAAREAARYGSAAGTSGNGVLYFKDCKGIRDAAKRVGFFAGVRDAIPDSDPPDQYYIHIGYYKLDDNAVLLDPETYADKCLGDYSGYIYDPSLTPRLVVKVSVGFRFLFLGLGEFPITSQSARTIVSEVDTDVVAGPIIPAPTTWPPTTTLTPTITLPPTLTPKHPTKTPVPPTATGPTPTSTNTPTPTSTFTPMPPLPPCGFVNAGDGVISGTNQYGFVVYNNSGVSSDPYYPAQNAWITQIYLKWSSLARYPATPTITPNPLETATTVPDPSPTIPIPTPTKTVGLIQIQFNGGNLRNANLNDPLVYIFDGAGSEMVAGTRVPIDFFFTVDGDTKLVIESAYVLMHYIDQAGKLQVCEVIPDPLVPAGY